MAMFIIENRHKNSPTRRIAFVHAKNKEEAIKKLNDRFPNSEDIRFIRFDQIITSYSTCTIR